MTYDRDDERRAHIERVRRGELRAPAQVPLPERVAPEAEDESVRPEADMSRRPWAAVAGSLALAVLACIPHWVAIFVAVAVACVGVPIAWGFRRITSGREQRMYIAITMTLLLTLALAAASIVIWMNLGVLTIPTLP